MTFEHPTSLGWLFLDLNSYFASVEQQLNPALRGKPVAVYEAKAFGIKTGTPIYEAKRMCKDLVCVLADHEKYVRFHHLILEEIDSIDEVACKLDRTQCNEVSARALAHRIKAGLHKNVGIAINCSIGIAPNRFLAKVATELEKPDGLVVIHPHEIPSKLLSLTFDDIPGIGRNMQRRLKQNGVYSLEDIYQLPPKRMRAIWHSVAGERMYYHLRGVEIETPPTKRSTVGHSHMLAPENRALPEATQVGKRLLLKAASRLRRLGYAATVMQLSIRFENGPRLGVDRKFRPYFDNQNLSDEWRYCWDKLMVACPQGRVPRIKKISVSLHGLVEQDKVQLDLFDRQLSPRSARSAELSAAMDKINKRYGRNAITTADTVGRANVVTGTKIAFSRIPEAAEFYE